MCVCVVPVVVCGYLVGKASLGADMWLRTDVVKRHDAEGPVAEELAAVEAALESFGSPWLNQLLLIQAGGEYVCGCCARVCVNTRGAWVVTQRLCGVFVNEQVCGSACGVLCGDGPRGTQASKPN